MSEQHLVTNRAIFHGRVQGVGFRATTKSIATRFSVAGYVRNLRDGTVEVIVRAAPSEADAFLAAVADRFAGYVTGSDVAETADAEVPPGFEIRF